jgi:hypothetical protein
MATLAMAKGPMGEEKEKSRPGQTVLFFVLVDVDHLSRLIHFDCDFSAGGNIPEHTALGFEFEMLPRVQPTTDRERLVLRRWKEIEGNRDAGSSSSRQPFHPAALHAGGDHLTRNRTVRIGSHHSDSLAS